MTDSRFHTPAETVLALRLAQQVHAGQIPLPAEIARVNQQIREKMRLAEIFWTRLGEADQFLLNEITDLRFLKDALYSRWIREEAKGLI